MIYTIKGEPYIARLKPSDIIASIYGAKDGQEAKIKSALEAMKEDAFEVIIKQSAAETVEVTAENDLATGEKTSIITGTVRKKGEQRNVKPGNDKGIEKP